MSTVGAAATVSRDLRIAERLRTFALALFVYSTVWLGLAVVFVSVVFGLKPLVISSGSMSPLIRPGDIVLIEELGEVADATDLGPGTVVTFAAGGQDDDRLVTHRILSVREAGRFITKGDANAGPDSDVVAAEDVVGVGRHLVPFVGLPAVWLATGNFITFVGWLLTTGAAVFVLWVPRRRPRASQEVQADRDHWMRAGVAIAVLGGMLVGPGVSDAALTDQTGNAGNAVVAGEWKKIVDLAAGEAHACVVRNEGNVWCWGRNDRGQLGDNTLVTRSIPVQVKGAGGSGALTSAAANGAGDKHSCVVKTDGSVWCWGMNNEGQLGDDTIIDRTAPVQVKGAGGTGTLASAVDVDGGDLHSCAQKAEGTVWCWGRNDRGQLGDNTTTDDETPVQVKGPGGTGTLTNVVRIATGAKHSCAVKSDGTVWCWGLNTDGQLGDSTTTDRVAPVQVKGPDGTGTLTGVVGVAGGDTHSCAVKSDGTVWCWGRNDRGQLGDNTTTNRVAPVQVKGVGGTGNLTGVTSVAAGAKHTCAVRSDGTMRCWGMNNEGQLGDNTRTDRPAPVQVVGTAGAGAFGNAVLAAGGDLFSCSAQSSYNTWCWGDNLHGQLGNGTTADSLLPARVLGSGWTDFTNVVDLAGGEVHSCAARSGGTVWCWGRNDMGQLGDATTTRRLTPSQVKGVGGSGTLTGVAKVGAGDKHSCAVKSDGTVWCWGLNNEGQLGDNTVTNRSAPVQVKGTGGAGTLTGVVDADGGDLHTCALKSDGTVWCWGRNDMGQLGDNTTVDKEAPVQVKGPGGIGTLTGATAVATGAKHSCAVKSDGTAWCWGLNNEGQLGDNTVTNRSAPLQVKGSGGSGTLTDAISVAGGDLHSCALKSDGTVWCWGRNDRGQLGDNTVIDKEAPVQVKGPGGTGWLTGLTAVATGVKHSCAVKGDDTVWCWGQNDKGQLGDNTTTNRSTPVQVTGPSGIGMFQDGDTIASGDFFSCATQTNDTAWCWGHNNEGQLGHGTTSDTTAPVQVP